MGCLFALLGGLFPRLALLILWSAWKLITRTADVLMEGAPVGLMVADLERTIRETPGVAVEAGGGVGSPDPPASTAEIDGLFGHMSEVLERIGFARDDSFAGVVRDLRRLAARAAPTSRDVAILRGVCRRAQRALER